ncbi:hypothetical protein V6C27_14405 [Peptococcaceae bacterium 1198_IL3148]
MRQNLNNGERLLSIVGGLAFTGLGMSDKMRGTFCGKAIAAIGIKNTLVGLVGYNPLLKNNDE